MIDKNITPVNTQKNLVRYLTQIIMFIGNSKLKAESKRTFAGILWWIFDPLVNLAVYYIVFGILLPGDKGEHFLAYVFLGLLGWRWFSICIITASKSIHSHHNLISQVYLPKVLFPLLDVYINTMKFLLVFIFVLLMFFMFGYPPTIYILWLPFILICELVLIVGLSLFLASLSPFFPDLNFVVQNFLKLLFYPCAIIFTLEQVPEKFHPYLTLNPLVEMFNNIRRAVIFGQPPNFYNMALTLSVGALFGVVGYFLLKKHDQTYPKLGM